MYKYYITAPADIVSGGPELAHQMCSELNNLGEKAFMYYIDSYQAEPIDTDVNPKFKKYNTTHIRTIKELDSTGSIIIFNEGATTYIPHIHASQKLLWWMSVDTYKACTQEKDIDVIRNEITLHLVQSHYAYEYVKNRIGISEENILYVSDYIADIYRISINHTIPRMNMALFNPQKGWDKICPLIEQTPWLKWIPLLNLSEEDMSAYMHLAKVYVDFGSHPGKDRIPREAASCGCCIITNKTGSAAYQEDVPIPDSYKFANEETQYTAISALLKDICQNYDQHSLQFETYRQIIAEEREKFTADVQAMIQRVNL